MTILPCTTVQIINRTGNFILKIFLLLSVFIFFTGCLNVSAQPGQPVPVKNNSKIWEEKDYARVSLSNFRKEPLFLETINFTSIDYPRLHASIFYATNEIRVSHKLKELGYNANLEIAAYNHSKRMVEKNFFSHQDSTDRTRYNPGDRAKLAGVTNPSIAENIAETFAIQYKAGTSVYPLSTPGEFSYTNRGKPIPPHTYLSFADEVLTMWMNSSGHRANILSTNGLELGCGAYFYQDKSFYQMAKFKATQNFQWYKKVIPGEVSDPTP
ncbi:MAG: CAP domain-containing protein [Spirochaetales bacterium]|nr:CAP domain-containing protein [Spirochaetales bacterium]